MSRRSLLSLVCVGCAVFFFSHVSNARFELSVDEANTKVFLRQLAPEVSLVVKNGSNHSIRSAIHLELLAPDNKIVTKSARNVDLKSGQQSVPFVLPIKIHDLTPEEESRILWYRLHYRIATEDEDHSSTEGFISLSQITPDLFDLNVISAKVAVPGKSYLAKVQAAHPMTRQPLKGVEIKGLITASDSQSNDFGLTASALTDSNGFADLVFSLPADLDDNDIELKIEGRLGFITVKADKDLNANNDVNIIVSTDKPLYQPGQTVHARMLMFGPARNALADKEVELEITDPEDTAVFSSTIKTSRFGIASAEWSIPDRIRLGDYTLEFKDSADDDHRAVARVKISRYDLPNFSVSAKTDRPYYLKDQAANVEIKADYLFGQPVKRGHVKLVRETERTWNYREQKYDIQEGDKYEGETLADGSFKATINLQEDFAELEKEDYNRFQDLYYTAYFTDPTTKRTEQNRFNIRLTKDAIHIYVIQPNDSYSQTRTLPFDFFVTTSYADGTPAQCNVNVSLPEKAGEAKLLRQVRTNRYGLANVTQLQIPSAALKGDSFELKLTAADNQSKSGTHTEAFSLNDEPEIRVQTKKPLLAPGEPIEATITSSEKNLQLNLSVARGDTTISLQPVSLQNGRAFVLIPYKAAFQDEITVNAYARSKSDDDDFIWGAHTVLYPRSRDLTVKVDSLLQSYKPGEQAHVSFRAISPGGKPVESALGVVVTDKAVDERVRSDQEYGYGGFYSNILSLMGSNDSIGPISRRSLDKIDASKPISPDLALVAEALLNQGHPVDSMLFTSDDYDRSQHNVFSETIKKQLGSTTEALKKAYEKSKIYPRTENTLIQLLNTAGVDFQSLRDPWGQPYRAQFFTEGISDFFVVKSAGADKRFDTEDDFEGLRLSWPYFKQVGELVDTAIQDYHRRTGAFIRNIETLRTELRAKNFNLDSLRDPWGQSYQIAFPVNGTSFQINFITAAPSNLPRDGREFTVWQSSIDYFAEQRFKIDTALYQHARNTNSFPTNAAALHDLLLKDDIDTNKLRDPWDRSYYFVFQSTSFYSDRVSVQTRMVNQTSSEQVLIRPVTANANVVRVRSAGPDAIEGTADDFEVGYFTATTSEQTADDQQPKAVRSVVSLSGSTGAITGIIRDSMEASIPGATVTAKAKFGDQIFETKTDDNGVFLFRNIPVGIYELKASSPGFKDCVVSQIAVRSSQIFQININLEVGSVAETVTVTSGQVEALNLSTAATVGSRKVTSNFMLDGVNVAKQQLTTPRVREYFPETLLWQPELTTNKQGRASLDFKLADNITTWRMSVIGSTADGQIGIADTEIRAFQPFFAELDPPRILTEGDRISLPVVLRNYLERKQAVDLTLRPENWFKVVDSAQKRTEVPAGDSRNETFTLQTVASVTDGKQRITALGSEFSDAVEKPVTVHPDGEEKFETTSDLLDQTTSLNLNLPANTIPNSSHVELKVYPNLMTHVWESVEAIMKRPYGCGEQTISSTYPSLLVLRYLKQERLESPIALKAQKYLGEGYQRLLGYQSPNGGFTYWGHGDADIALTAYAIRFLRDASTVTNVDESVVLNASRWLIEQQRPDGSWPAYNWDKKEDLTRTAMTTALVTRTLATSEKKANLQIAALKKAIDYLEQKTGNINEPYLIASYSLAASLAGDSERAAKANALLKTLAHSEGQQSYWSLEANTPFYGWGLAGRVETTALAVQALARANDSGDAEIRNLKTRGLLFLLRNQDPYGVWYSTQATINVLDAMLSLVSKTQASSAANSIEVVVNGQATRTISLPTDSRLTAPVIVDVTSMIKNGANQVEFRRSAGGSVVSLQLVSNYYVPWGSNQSLRRTGDAESVRLETSFDKNQTNVSEEITCRVKAERIGFRGYGMMLAEIGLPPGSDVDRASLETAIRNSNWSINQYDVLPDRVVVYLWPQAGGTEFTFKFRPRMAMAAKTAASSVYDYYNPEARAVVAPTKFLVK